MEAMISREAVHEGMLVVSADQIELGHVVELDEESFRVEKGSLLAQDVDVPYDDVVNVAGERVAVKKRGHDYTEAANGEPMVTPDELDEVARGELSPETIEETERKL